MKNIIVSGFVLLSLSFVNSYAQDLNENCTVNILNRTIQVANDGSWNVPNIPSTLGRIRARVTCLDETGQTRSGQTPFFNIVENRNVDVPDFIFADNQDVVESAIDITFSLEGDLNFTTDKPIEFPVFKNDSEFFIQPLSAEELSGVNWLSTNPDVVSYKDGILTPIKTGSAIISARLDGAILMKRVTVSIDDGRLDTDSDGIPDEVELANGLDPNDPIDAFEDQDKDGLSALEEFILGTAINEADTDGDGLKDGEELVAGDDGFISDPLLVDTDGDGVNDGVEVSLGTDPSDANDRDYDSAVTVFNVTPESFLLTNNTILPDEIGQQLKVTGTLIDGGNIDLTEGRGTNYTSSDLSVCNFGADEGLVYGTSAGECDIEVKNGSLQKTVSATVSRFDPKAVSVISIPGYANNVDISGDYAYVAAGRAGLQVVSLDLFRESPVIVGSYNTFGTSIDVKVDGNTAYLADGFAGVLFFDISNPSSPDLISRADTGLAQDIQVLNNYVYVADGNSGFKIIDATDLTSPKTVGSVFSIGTAKGVAVNGDTAVVGTSTGLFVIDVSDPVSPFVRSSIALSNIKDVEIEGDYAYVAAYTSGFAVVDISDPDSPNLLVRENDFVPRDLAITGGLALYAEQLFPNAITYVNIREPANAVFQGTIDLSSLGDYAGTGIAIDDQFAYISAENFVVRDDFDDQGNTVLMIAQYRQVTDNEGISPTVKIISPDVDSEYVQGESVQVTVEAKDDIAVATTELLVDDVVVARDASKPYQLKYLTPTDVFGQLVLSARAIDLGGNVSPTSVTVVTVNEDPKTTAQGKVVSPFGGPRDPGDPGDPGDIDATVRCQGVETDVNTDGTFSIPGLSTLAPFRCEAYSNDFEGFFGQSDLLEPVRGGITDFGEIVLDFPQAE